MLRGDNLFCPGQKITSPQFGDSWYRTFRGYPDMNEPVKSLITEYIKGGEYGKVIIFLTGECGFDNDYSEFLLREFITGNL